MAGIDFAVKRGSTANPLNATLKDAAGAAIPLTGATVTFFMRLMGATTNKINGGAVTVVNATAGTVRYPWTAADIDTSGFYRAEFKITFSDTTILRVPEFGYLVIQVGDPLG